MQIETFVLYLRIIMNETIKKNAMKKLKCNFCEKTYLIDRQPNSICDEFFCTECDVTLAYVSDAPYTKKLTWKANIEYQKHVDMYVATIINWD